MSQGTMSNPGLDEAVKAGNKRNAMRTPDHVSTGDLRASDHEAEHATPRVRQRRKHAQVIQDMFYIPREEIPDGLDYEWKRWSNVGQQDPFYISRLREDGGWEPVPPARHPTWVPEGYKEPYIIKGGMILMDRPMEFTLEARAEARMLAKQQVREAEQRLGLTGEGEATRDLAEVRPRIQKEMMRPMPIQE